MKRYVTPTTVIATLALFVALGGSSLAAANYIDGASIRPNSIPANRLTQSAIRELGRSRMLTSASRASLLQGTAQGINGVQVHFVGSFGELKAGEPHTLQTMTATCPQGWQLTSGGFNAKNDAEQFILVESMATFSPSAQPTVGTPGDQPTVWTVSGYDRDANPKAPPMKFDLRVGCLRTV